MDFRTRPGGFLPRFHDAGIVSAAQHPPHIPKARGDGRKFRPRRFRVSVQQRRQNVGEDPVRMFVSRQISLEPCEAGAISMTQIEDRCQVCRFSTLSGQTPRQARIHMTGFAVVT